MFKTGDAKLTKNTQEKNSPSSLLPIRPGVSKYQAVAMATRLFNLSMADDSSVKELDSYEDRNFLLRGLLNREPQDLDVSTCKEYVIKIVNHFDSNHEGLIQAQCDVMLFLQARDYKCPIAVHSIFNTPFVMCKIPRGSQPDSIALATDDGTREYEVEIYDGEEYSEEEYFVCAVRLLTFVPGTVLNEIPLNTQLLFDAGKAVARLDQDLKEFGCPKLERTEFMWDLTCVEKVEQFLEVVDDHHRVEMVREVCEAFRTKVAPKLHVLPKQVIHGDVNCTNMLLTPHSNNLVHDFGFIDFADLNYSCRVFDVAIPLMYILNHPHELSCGRSRMAGYFFAGYHSVNPLTDEEIKLLPILVALRFCQSLVYGAFTNKYMDPDNEYIIETARNGWKQFGAFWKLPEEEMLKMWLQMSNKVEKREGNQ